MTTERGQWLADSPGYFALGFDEYVGGGIEIPVWTVNAKTLEEISAAVVVWVAEALEFDGLRIARIYYSDDGGITQGCDLEIKTIKREDD